MYPMMLLSGDLPVGDVDLRFAFAFRAAGADFATTPTMVRSDKANSK